MNQAKWIVAFPVAEEDKVLQPVAGESGTGLESFDAAAEAARLMSLSPHCWGTPYLVINKETKHSGILYLNGDVFAGSSSSWCLVNEEGVVEDV